MKRLVLVLWLGLSAAAEAGPWAAGRGHFYAKVGGSPDLADFGSESGIGDVQAGLQFQLGQRGPWVLAVRGMVQAPTGDETRAEGLLPTGSGVWEGEAVVGAGRSFAKGKVYGFVESGHQVRGGGLNDGLTYALQVGWNVRPRITSPATSAASSPTARKRPRRLGVRPMVLR